MTMGICIHAYGGYMGMGIQLHVLKGLGWQCTCARARTVQIQTSVLQ
jgi:hypothetical protein